ncbi:MAG: sugar phosphate isomerase/epimerase family protein, partial [Armatimonadia bacterium]
DVPIGEVIPLIDEHGADYVKALFADNGLKMGSIGFPVRWMGSADDWNADLLNLPKYCEAASQIGATRAATWVPSWNDERDWDENCAFHRNRLGPVAEVMGAYGVRMGLEFLGPKTLRAGKKFEFIHTMEQMLELCSCLGQNAGLLLDAWHWYTSGGTLAQLKKLTNENVVYVHINDAPPDIALDDQVDSVRALPGETGVINLTGFLQVLRDIGYDGPVTPEPFSARLNAMEDKSEAVKLAGKMLKQVFEETIE